LFSRGDRGLYGPLLESLVHRDPFFVLADFEAYLQAQSWVDEHWMDTMAWRRSSIFNTARSGFFSSDRSIQTYANDVWKVKPMPVQLACEIDQPHGE
jgi:starch phosphorylase